MLIMRRRAGESLLIGEDVEIEILEIGPTRVKLGIAAPLDTPIARKEVILTRAENRTAARSADPQVISWLAEKLKPVSGSVKSLTEPSHFPETPAAKY